MNNPATQGNKGKRIIHIETRASKRTIKSNITVSRDLKKYFRRLTFHSRFDEEICANKSILNIPALSILLPLAWITGTDVYVDELDKSYAESVQFLQEEFKKMYPRAPFNTKIIANRFIENR